MTFHRLGLINKDQRGFTLIELLIAIAITGLVTGGITGAIFQVFAVNARTSNHMTAVRQVQNAGYWVSHDVQMAQSVVITGVSGLCLTWTDWDGTINEVTYTIVDSELKRSHSINGEAPTETIVAQFIDPDNTKFEFTGGSAFSLPDSGDAFKLTATAVTSATTVVETVGTVSVTVLTDTDGDVTIAYTDPTWTITLPDIGDEVLVTPTGGSATGYWTSTTGTATATITTGDNATLADGGVLVLTVTATVGDAIETRVYEVMPRPNS